jgi:hypothetical protein
MKMLTLMLLEILSGLRHLMVELLVHGKKSSISVRLLLTLLSTYNFGGDLTVAQFVATAQTLENTGVSAYTGAINTIRYRSLSLSL